MNLDKYQQAWQSQASQTKVTIDTDLLLKEVQRSQQHFRAIILIRDFREVGVALLMLPVWFYLGYRLSMPWTWYLAVPAMIWVAGFIVIDRKRHPQKLTSSDVSLIKCVQDSLDQVEHQIWLLRNVFWWYLMPFTIPILAFFIHVGLRNAKGPLDVLASSSMCAFILGLYYFVDWINQRAVRTNLEPRRQELITLRSSLRDDSLEDAVTISSEEAVKEPKILRRWIIVALICLVILVLIAVTW